MGYAGLVGNCYGRGDYYQGDYYQGDYYRGDPGFLSGIGKFVGGAFRAVSSVANLALNPGGAIAGALLGKLTHRPSPPNPLQGTALAPFAPSIATGQGIINLGSPSLVNMNLGEPSAKAGTAMVTTPSGQLVLCSTKGTHLNRSGYFTRHGYVAKGSVCVRNRRMNPANGHALRRALRRVNSFGRIVKRLKKAIGRANTAVGNVHHARKKTIGRK